jgi:hypothetical protein
VIGCTYLERGRPVVVLCGWKNGKGDQELDRRYRTEQRSRFGPRNVLIEREDGTKIVRPFRGLRRPREQNVSMDQDQEEEIALDQH